MKPTEIPQKLRVTLEKLSQAYTITTVLKDAILYNQECSNFLDNYSYVFLLEQTIGLLDDVHSDIDDFLPPESYEHLKIDP